MKRIWPWRQRPNAESEQTKPGKDDGPPIDIRKPREAIYKTFTGRPGPCPRCGGELRQSYQSYMVVTRRGNKITDSFMIGDDMGWFCKSCPTVVINPEDVNEMMQYQLSHWDAGDEFAVLGLVDLDAVPKDKQSVPLGEEGNPIPLVEFTNISGGTRPGGRRRSGQRRTTGNA